MTVVYSQNFDSLTAGALNAQDSWSGNTAYVVQTAVVNSGTKALSAPSNLNGSGIARTITAITTGTPIATVYMRGTTASGYEASFFIGDGTSFTFGAYMFNDNTFQFYDGIAFRTTGVSWSINTWYKVEIQEDVVNKQARMRVNGGTWTSYFQNNAYVAQLSTIRAVTVGTSGGTGYWDDISVDDGAVAVNSRFFNFM